MTSSQALGQIRVLLTALSGVLITWGITDGHGWAPITGIIMAALSLGIGIRRHLHTGSLPWSLVRKLANASGAAAVTYGVLHPEQMDKILALIAAMGPLLAGVGSFIANDEGPDIDFGGGSPMLLILFGIFLLGLPSCAGWDATGQAYILDATSGAKAGLTLTGEGTTFFGKVPVIDDETGEEVGLAEISITRPHVEPAK